MNVMIRSSFSVVTSEKHNQRQLSIELHLSHTVATCTHPDATCSSVNVSHSDVRCVKSSLAVMDECHSQNFLRCLRDRMIFV